MRTIVITGGGTGIGAEITRAFHEAGDTVVILSRTSHGLAQALGSRCLEIACDISVPSQIEQAAAGLKSVDVWINNAGFSEWRSVAEADEQFWDKMIDTNLKGAFFGCRTASARMGQGGVILNVSSLAGKRGSANNAVYCASKFGVNGITQALAKELGARGIRVNAVCPVYVETSGLREALAAENAPPGGEDVAAYLSAFARQNSALGRLPTGAEVAQTCLFLASSAASAITGQCINVDCGVLPQ